MTSIDSVAAKVDQLAVSQAQTHNAVKALDLSLRGDGGSELGLAARVKVLECFRYEVRRLIRFLVVGIAGLFLNLAWEVIQTYLETRP